MHNNSSSAIAAASPPEWISGLEARRQLGLSYSSLARLAMLGKVATLLEPGITVRYSAGDVARLAGGRPSSAIADR